MTDLSTGFYIWTIKGTMKENNNIECEIEVYKNLSLDEGFACNFFILFIRIRMN